MKWGGILKGQEKKQEFSRNAFHIVLTFKSYKCFTYSKIILKLCLKGNLRMGSKWK